MKRTHSKVKTKGGRGAIADHKAELRSIAEALRGSMDAAEYKRVVLGLIFPVFIFDAFEEMRKLEPELEGSADSEYPDEYRCEHIFWVPEEAPWSNRQAQACEPCIGELVDDAIVAVEKDNPAPGVVPQLLSAEMGEGDMETVGE